MEKCESNLKDVEQQLIEAKRTNKKVQGVLSIILSNAIVHIIAPVNCCCDVLSLHVVFMYIPVLLV